MMMWTFGKKVAAGFAMAFVLVAGIGAVASRSIDTLTRASYLTTHSHAVIEHAELVMSEMKDAETGQRGFVITGDESYLEPFTTGGMAIVGTMNELRQLTIDNPGHQKHLDEAETFIGGKLEELRKTIGLRRTQGFEATQREIVGGQGKRYMDDLRRIMEQMERDERDLLRKRADEVEASASGGRMAIGLGTLLCLLLSTAVWIFLTRSLTSQIGSAVRHVQSSSGELQTAATQQSTVSKEQASAMSEITTTISELMATSRQIAESAQRVARVASETASAARGGDDTVQKTYESVTAIKRQVDVIVTYMIELGKKSQQIGSVLEIINELAEQTNILAINATIEAAGAGEMGRRFAVVADEIRKLADRVGGSTKDIRALVDDIRAAVNTTVMATEGGSKAVDAGTRQFNDVAASFKQIAGLVTTTSEAAKEIELSTKQQSSAVEQLNLAIASVSQAAKETEASAGQTLQTSSELAKLSKELGRLIQSQPDV